MSQQESKAISYQDRNILRHNFNNVNCDVVFVVNEKKFPAHKIIVGGASDYLTSLIEDHFKNTSSPEIPLPHIKFTASFSSLLEYIYGIDFQVSQHSIPVIAEMVQLARDFGLHKLHELLSRYLSKLDDFSNITMDVAITLVNMAAEHGLHKLNERITHFLNQNTKELFDHDSFVRLDPEVLLDLLHSDHFYAKEINILRALLKWIDANVPESRPVPAQNIPYHLRSSGPCTDSSEAGIPEDNKTLRISNEDSSNGDLNPPDNEIPRVSTEDPSNGQLIRSISHQNKHETHQNSISHQRKGEILNQNEDTHVGSNELENKYLTFLSVVERIMNRNENFVVEDFEVEGVERENEEIMEDEGNEKEMEKTQTDEGNEKEMKETETDEGNEKEMEETQTDEGNEKEMKETETDEGNEKEMEETQTDEGNEREMEETQTDEGNEKEMAETQTDEGNEKEMEETQTDEGTEKEIIEGMLDRNAKRISTGPESNEIITRDSEGSQSDEDTTLTCTSTSELAKPNNEDQISISASTSGMVKSKSEDQTSTSVSKTEKSLFPPNRTTSSLKLARRLLREIRFSQISMVDFFQVYELPLFLQYKDLIHTFALASLAEDNPRVRNCDKYIILEVGQVNSRYEYKEVSERVTIGNGHECWVEVNQQVGRRHVDIVVKVTGEEKSAVKKTYGYNRKFKGPNEKCTVLAYSITLLANGSFRRDHYVIKDNYMEKYFGDVETDSNISEPEVKSDCSDYYGHSDYKEGEEMDEQDGHETSEDEGDSDSDYVQPEEEEEEEDVASGSLDDIPLAERLASLKGLPSLKDTEISFSDEDTSSDFGTIDSAELASIKAKKDDFEHLQEGTLLSHDILFHSDHFVSPESSYTVEVYVQFYCQCG